MCNNKELDVVEILQDVQIGRNPYVSSIDSNIHIFKHKILNDPCKFNLELKYERDI